MEVTFDLNQILTHIVFHWFIDALSLHLIGLKSSYVRLCINRQCHLRGKVRISLPCIYFSSSCYSEKTKIKQSNSSVVLFCLLSSILVRTTEWESIRANMPWLLDAIVCVALDLFVSCSLSCKFSIYSCFGCTSLSHSLNSWHIFREIIT